LLLSGGGSQSGLIGPLLQFQLLTPQVRPVASATVRSDQDRRRLRIDPPAFRTPPASNRCHGKFTSVMVGAHGDKARVSSQIVDAAGKALGTSGPGKS
jgi:hypothetical protein